MTGLAWPSRRIRSTRPLNGVFVAASIAVLAVTAAAQPQAAQSKPASDATKAANAKILKELPFSDKTDFENAKRGLIAPLPGGGVVKSDKGDGGLERLGVRLHRR